MNDRPGNPVFEIVVATLERMQAIAQQNGTCMIVVFQPSKEEVYLPLLDGSAPDAGAPLRPILDAQGIRYLDLLPAFRARAETGAQLFFETDGHPNRQGYQLIADEIGAYLKAHAAGGDLADVCALPDSSGQSGARPRTLSLDFPHKLRRASRFAQIE